MNTLDWDKKFDLSERSLNDRCSHVTSPPLVPFSGKEREVEEHFLMRLNNLGTWVFMSFVLWVGVIYLVHEVWKGLF